MYALKGLMNCYDDNCGVLNASTSTSNKNKKICLNNQGSGRIV